MARDTYAIPWRIVCPPVSTVPGHGTCPFRTFGASRLRQTEERCSEPAAVQELARRSRQEVLAEGEVFTVLM